jgi:hypothetical protein
MIPVPRHGGRDPGADQDLSNFFWLFLVLFWVQAVLFRVRSGCFGSVHHFRPKTMYGFPDDKKENGT